MLNSKGAVVVWLTGLSGAGKTTIAQLLYQYFKRQTKPIELLDGDVVRALFPGTGFSRSERSEHIKRIAFTASRLQHHGINVIVSLVSPYEDSREFSKKLCGKFLEIYISTTLAECRKRDPKGLYQKYDQGLIKNMSGLDDVYEVPKNPNLTVDTVHRTPEDCANEIIALLT